jgi:hypothetical protein
LKASVFAERASSVESAQTGDTEQVDEAATCNIYILEASHLSQFLNVNAGKIRLEIGHDSLLTNPYSLLTIWYHSALHNVTYQDSPATQQLSGASLLYSLVSATMKTNASS